MIQPGQTLTARSLCDYDCIYTVNVLERKGKFVRVEYQGEVKRVMVRVDSEGREYIYALGVYSMCPMFREPKV